MNKILAATAALTLMSAGAFLPTAARADANCGSMSQTSQPGPAPTATTADNTNGCAAWGTGRETKNGPGVSGADTQTAPNVGGDPVNGEKH
jgi:hypothetical protein